MKTVSRLFAAGALAGLAFVVQPAAAQTIIGNLGTTSTTYTSYLGATNGYKSTGFTMGSASYTLTGAVLDLYSDTSATPVLQLFGGTPAGLSGNALLTFTNASPVTTAGEYMFSSSAYTLNAGSTYWLTLSNRTAGSLRWFAGDVIPTGPGATSDGYVTGFNSQPPDGQNPSSYLNIFAVQGSAINSAVPEPATWGMMILGLGVVGFALRRRVRASEVRFDARIKRIAAGEIA